jgi:NADH:ubiquinone oxidoreductase subunit 3 (subunit A)
MNYFAEKYQLKYMVVVLLLVIVGVSIAVMVPMQVGKYFGDREGFVQFGDFC